MFIVTLLREQFEKSKNITKDKTHLSEATSDNNIPCQIIDLTNNHLPVEQQALLITALQSLEKGSRIQKNQAFTLSSGKVIKLSHTIVKGDTASPDLAPLNPQAKIRYYVHANAPEKQRLGEGAFGTVSSIKAVLTIETQHIKFSIHPHVIKKVKENPEEEIAAARQASSLKPSNPVSIKNNHYAFYMRNKGRTLEKYSEAKRMAYNVGNSFFSTTETCEILHQLLESAQLALKNNYIFLDIKPQNILIDNAGKITICDHGRTWPTNKISNHCMGTIAYSAPETFPDNQKGIYPTEKMMVFSIGMVIAELLVGFGIYDGRADFDKQIEARLKIAPSTNWIKCWINRNPDENNSLGQLLHQMLEMDPNQRISIDQAIESLKEIMKTNNYKFCRN